MVFWYNLIDRWDQILLDVTGEIKIICINSYGGREFNYDQDFQRLKLWNVSSFADDMIMPTQSESIKKWCNLSNL